MKILDRYILVSFLKTFGSVFIILFFIFILQGIWLFIADLAGKDLSFFLVVKFLMFYSPKVIPLVLPLSVLLASIMTFGSLAENYEFAAMKASGISLKRALYSLTIFVIVLSLVAFVFANNLIPKAEYEFTNLKKSIMQQKPSSAIAAGQFSKIGNFVIKVDKKSGENDNHLEKVIIHKISSLGNSTNVVIKADYGELIGSEDSDQLQLVLYNGNYYEEIEPKKFEDRQRQQFAKSSFHSYAINMDLSKLDDSNYEDDSKITNTKDMLNVRQLSYTIDSLENSRSVELASFKQNIQNRLTGAFYHTPSSVTQSKVNSETKLMDIVPISQKRVILNLGKLNFENSKFYFEDTHFLLTDKSKNINNHILALHDKFVIAYGCLLMFFIGAPLGAIIRKGGVGLPIVFAIIIFIIYHFTTVFGKKIAQDGTIPALLGSWISSIILTPLAIFLTYRATNDQGLFNIGDITHPIQVFFKKVFIKNKTNDDNGINPA